MMNIKPIDSGNRHIILKYLVDKNFQEVLTEIIPNTSLNSKSLKRIGPGTSIFEIRRCINDNMEVLSDAIGMPLDEWHGPLNSGDMWGTIKRVVNDGFRLLEDKINSGRVPWGDYLDDMLISDIDNMTMDEIDSTLVRPDSPIPEQHLDDMLMSDIDDLTIEEIDPKLI